MAKRAKSGRRVRANPVAKALRTGRLRLRVVKPKRGKGAYTRKTRMVRET